MVRINRSVSRLSYGVAMQAKQYEVTRVQAVDGEAFPQMLLCLLPLLKKLTLPFCLPFGPGALVNSNVAAPIFPSGHPALTNPT